MKKLSICLFMLLCVGFLPAHSVQAAGQLHGLWKNAKKESQTKFEQALERRNSILAQAAQEGDAQAKAQALTEALADSGLMDEGKSPFLSYMNFNQNFGKELDKLEKGYKNNLEINNKLRDLEGSNALEFIAKDKKFSKAFLEFLKKKQAHENWLFYIESKKKKADYLYETYINKGSKAEVNIDSDLRNAWKKAKDDGNLKREAKELIKKTNGEIVPLMTNNRFAEQFLATPETRQLAGIKDISELKKKVLETALEYDRKVVAYQTRWEKFKVDFWSPLRRALNTIVEQVNQM